MLEEREMEKRGKGRVLRTPWLVRGSSRGLAAWNSP